MSREQMPALRVSCSFFPLQRQLRLVVQFSTLRICPKARILNAEYHYLIGQIRRYWHLSPPAEEPASHPCSYSSGWVWDRSASVDDGLGSFMVGTPSESERGHLKADSTPENAE